MTIIVILAAMLMPALQQAREKTKQAVCTNNLRQIGIEMVIFCKEHGGYFPPYYISIANTPYWGNGRYETPGSWSWWEWFRDVPSAEIAQSRRSIFKCPSNPTTTWHAPWNKYVYNQYLNQIENDGKEWRNDTTIRPASALVMVADASFKGCYQIPFTSPNDYTDPSAGNYAMGYWHSEGANLLYVDGHVEWHTSEEIQGAIRTTPWPPKGTGTGTGHPWWNPWDPER